MTNLEPCPFCPDGGDPHHFGGAGHHCVKCSECGRTNERLVCTESDGWHYEAFDSAQEAYDDWNARYKRTCKVVCASRPNGAEGLGNFGVCSECGGTIEVADQFSPRWKETDKFCRSCGAEVVDG